MPASPRAVMLGQATQEALPWPLVVAFGCARVPPAVMLGQATQEALPRPLVIVSDAFGFADAEPVAAFQPPVERLRR